MKVSELQRNSLEYLLSELRRITGIISRRMQEIAATASREDDEFRGLYISEEEINQLLNDPALFLASDYGQVQHLDPADRGGFLATSRLQHLRQTCGLSPFELDVVLIALAPELELRYEKLFAYLQDDVTRRRPTVDLALNLLCPGLAGQLAARRCFDPDAPLLRYRLLELSEENQSKQPGLLSRSFKLDEGIIAFLLGEARLDARLRLFATFAQAQENSPRLSSQAEDYTERLAGQDTAYACVLVGPDEISKQNLAVEVCRRLQQPLIIVDTALLAGQNRPETLLRLLERESLLHSAPLFWSAYENWLPREGESANAAEFRRLFARFLTEEAGVSFVSAVQALPPLLISPIRPEFQLALDLPGYRERQHLWEMQLGQAALGLDLEGLSSRFRLNSGQILAAIVTARHAATWRGEITPTLEDLEAACRRHSNQRLNNLARKITARYRWDDIVLPTDQAAMLSEIVEQVRHRAMVYEKWGYDRKISLGKGLNAVFAGQSGTGKTMAAEIIAGELRMDLYKIDLSNVVSKYIGETEKNLERIFTEAGESNAILFFDEADSIFGKRSEVKDAHDRYANIETGYLLQKMEEYEGIVILATNLRKNLDDAFIRRMHFMIEFPFPEEDDRYQIWRRAFPDETPIAADVDLRFMAHQFKIAGGNIKNIGLASAFLAAADFSEETQQVAMRHIIRATRREFQKIGKLVTESEFGPYYQLVKLTEFKASRLNGSMPK